MAWWKDADERRIPSPGAVKRMILGLDDDAVVATEPRAEQGCDFPGCQTCKEERRSAVRFIDSSNGVRYLAVSRDVEELVLSHVNLEERCGTCGQVVDARVNQCVCGPRCKYCPSRATQPTG